MTKILIASDSHGSTAELEKLLEKHRDEAYLMIHCGDSELSAADPLMQNFRGVRGNCDFDSHYPEDRVEEIAGRRLFVTHGHRYSVKSQLMSLLYRAKELDADIVCFGHSHVFGAEIIDDTLFINPGSILLPRMRTERTYIILEFAGEEIQMHVYDIESGELAGLSRDFTLPKRQ